MQDTKNWFDKFENLPLLEALNKRVNLQANNIVPRYVWSRRCDKFYDFINLHTIGSLKVVKFHG